MEVCAKGRSPCRPDRMKSFLVDSHNRLDYESWKEHRESVLRLVDPAANSSEEDVHSEWVMLHDRVNDIERFFRIYRLIKNNLEQEPNKMISSEINLQQDLHYVTGLVCDQISSFNEAAICLRLKLDE